MYRDRMFTSLYCKETLNWVYIGLYRAASEGKPVFLRAILSLV